jgi:hypothetical protein
MGPEGCAFLYVRADRVAAGPARRGWTSHEDAFSFLFEGAGICATTARPEGRGFFESGALNTVGLRLEV